MYNVNRVFWTKSLDVNAVYLEKRYCLWSIVYEKVFVLEKMFVLISRSKFSKNQFFVNKCIIETKWLVEIIYVWKNHWHAHLWRNYGFFIHYLKERRGKGKFEIVAIFHLIDHQKKKNPTKDSVVTIDDNISSNYSLFSYRFYEDDFSEMLRSISCKGSGKTRFHMK